MAVARTSCTQVNWPLQTMRSSYGQFSGMGLGLPLSSSLTRSKKAAVRAR